MRLSLPARCTPRNSGDMLTCHGIFPASAITVRPIEGTDDEKGPTDGRDGLFGSLRRIGCAVVSANRVGAGA